MNPPGTVIFPLANLTSSLAEALRLANHTAGTWASKSSTHASISSKERREPLRVAREQRSILVGERAGPAPRLSVIVPTYRRPGALDALLESLKGQTALQDFEVVLSDDEMSGEALRTAEKYARTFRRLRYVSGPNAGPGVARNRGVAEASTALLAFIDDDCLTLPYWIASLLSAFESGAAIVQGPLVSSVPAIEPFVHAFSLSCPGKCGVFAIRRDTFVQLGGFDELLSRYGEDQEFFARAQERGVQVTFLEEARVIHPPRLKSLRVPLFQIRRATHAYEAEPRLCTRVPGCAQHLVHVNRRLLAISIVKLVLLAGCLALASRDLSAGVLATILLLSMPMGRWYMANRALRRAGERLRVPLAVGLAWSVLFPFNDPLLIAERVARGRFSLC